MAREGTSLILAILQTEQQLLCPHPEGIDLTQYTDLLGRHRKPALHAVLFWLNQLSLEPFTPGYAHPLRSTSCALH